MKKLNIIIVLVVIGFIYNLYLSFAPIKKDKEPTVNELIKQNEITLKLAPQILDITNDTVKSYLETKEAYNKFLKESDIIIKDSLNCNCPNKTN